MGKSSMKKGVVPGWLHDNFFQVQAQISRDHHTELRNLIILYRSCFFIYLSGK